MADKDQVPERRSTRDISLIFSLSMALLALSGVCLLIVGATNHPEEHLWAALCRDFGIGLDTGVVAAVSIEKLAAAKLRAEVAREISEAIYGQFVTPRIFDQVRDSIFRADACRLRWRVDISVLDPTKHATGVYLHLRDELKEVAAERLVLQVEISYDLQSTSSHKRRDFSVTGGIDLDPSPCTTVAIPCFSRIELDGGRAVFEVNPEQAGSALRAPSEGETRIRDATEKRTLALTRDTQQLRFATPWDLPPHPRTVHVRYVLRRAVRVSGNYVLSASVPAEGIEILFHGEGFRSDVMALHPNPKALALVGTGHWSMEEGILPWQGFAIRIEREEDASSVAEVPAAGPTNP